MFSSQIVNQITTLLIGFSVFGCLLLLLAYAFFLRQMRKSAFAVAACAVLLGTLCALQIAHYSYLTTGADLLAMRGYGVLLFAAPAAFYFFSTHVLMPDRANSWFELVHLVPVALGFVLPVKWVAPVAFTIGTAYSLWFARVVYRIRHERVRFPFEMFFFGLFALLAVVILLLGFLIPYVDHRLFYLVYANATGLSLFLVIAGLIAFPELLTDMSDAARMAYASSTLKGVDKDGAVARLAACMNDQKLYEDENLNLSALAQACELTGHQLSELINTTYGIGFSRYVRRQRVAQAKKLLLEDARSSVLSIGLATGFKSQSAFYAAFREETGEAPGRFRKSSAQEA